MTSYFKKFGFVFISLIAVSAIFIFFGQLNIAKADDIPVIDQTVADINTGIASSTSRVAALLAGEETGKGAEYFRLQASSTLPKERALLKKVTQAIINMVNTGNNDNPYYVTNILQYLADTTISAIANFLKDPALDNVCEPYQDSVKQAAGNVAPKFASKIQCTTDSNKLDEFNNGDFVNGGGWDTWGQVYMAPQNNLIGAKAIALTEEQKREDDAVESAKLEASWGNGFTSIKVCDPSKADPDKNYDGCDIKTPGEVIANKLNSADITNVEQMQTATDFNEISLILASSTEYSKPGALSKPKGLQQEDNGQQDNPQDTENGSDNNPGGNGGGGSSGSGSNYNGGNGGNNSGSSGSNGGTNGSNGTNGSSGTNGSNGTSGTNGSNGTNGSSGTNGSNGTSGTNGSNGTNGTNGSNNGSTGSSNSTDLNNYFNPNGTINFNLALDNTSNGNGQAQTTVNPTVALKLIDLQITTEIQYYNAQDNIYNLLDVIQQSFASSVASTCTNTIKNNVIGQITGSISYDKTSSSNLSWNKADIENAQNKVISNINILNTARASVLSNPNSQTTLTQVQSLIASNSMHSSANVNNYSTGGTTYGQVKNWVTTTVNTNLTSCNISKAPLSGWGI